MNDSIFSFLVACGLHVTLLFGAAGLVARPPRYDVQGGTGGVEISLIAAPPAAAKLQAPPAASETPEKNAEPAAERIHSTPRAGDGSSLIPGEDPTTFYLPGGAAGAGGRFANPAPAYPYEAIRQGQEGLVALDVSVDRNGYPVRVQIRRSSGFPLLDQSALQTVQRWRFDPAIVGFLPVEAKVRVPVRFVLEEELKRLRL